MRSEPVGMYEESSLCDIRGLTDFHTCIITSHRKSTHENKYQRRDQHRKSTHTRDQANNRTESDRTQEEGCNTESEQVAQNFLEDLCSQHRHPADAFGTRISFLIANRCSKRKIVVEIAKQKQQERKRETRGRKNRR